MATSSADNLATSRSSGSTGSCWSTSILEGRSFSAVARFPLFYSSYFMQIMATPPRLCTSPWFSVECNSPTAFSATTLGAVRDSTAARDFATTRGSTADISQAIASKFEFGSFGGGGCMPLTPPPLPLLLNLKEGFPLHLPLILCRYAFFMKNWRLTLLPVTNSMSHFHLPFASIRVSPFSSLGPSSVPLMFILLLF